MTTRSKALFVGGNELTAADLLTAGELPLSAAAQAHARMEAGEISGRLLLRPERAAGAH